MRETWNLIIRVGPHDFITFQIPILDSNTLKIRQQYLDFERYKHHIRAEANNSNDFCSSKYTKRLKRPT